MTQRDLFHCGEGKAASVSQCTKEKALLICNKHGLYVFHFKRTAQIHQICCPKSGMVSLLKSPRGGGRVVKMSANNELFAAAGREDNVSISHSSHPLSRMLIFNLD